MPKTEFEKAVTQAARRVARAELDLRRARKLVAELEVLLRARRAELRLLVTTVEPYEPPTITTQAAFDQAAEEAEP